MTIEPFAKEQKHPNLQITISVVILLPYQCRHLVWSRWCRYLLGLIVFVAYSLIYAPVIWTHPGHDGGKAGIITSFPWGWGECSFSLLHPIGEGVSRRFTFDLSAVAFSYCLVIWTFHINCLRSLCSCFLLLEILFNVWWGDLERLSQPILHRGLWFVQLSTKGWGLHSVFLPRCLGTSLDCTLTLSECPCH